MGLIHSPRIVRDSLIQYLDAGNVKSYPGSGLTWKDMCGKNNDGNNSTGGNACSFESSEPKCFVFDASNNNGRILMPKIFHGNNHGSLEVWFQHNQSTSTAAGPGMIFFEGNANGYGPETEFHLSVNGSGNVALFVEGGPDDLNMSTTTTVPANTWACATVTFINFSGSGQKNARVYINGIFDVTQSNYGNYGGQGTPSNSFIGRSRTQITSKYRGLVGKVAVVKCYSRRLTDSEVLQNYNALKGRFGL